MTSTALAAVHRAQTLDRLYLAAEAAEKRWMRALGSRFLVSATDEYAAYKRAQAAYDQYSAMCMAAPLDPLLPAAEEEQP